MQADADVKEIVNEFLGVPYRHMGRSIRGLDCYGLIVKIYERLGIRLFEVIGNYSTGSITERNLFIVNYHKQWMRVKTPDLFDVVLIRSSGNIVDHAGVYIGEGKFIHTSRAGTVIARLSAWQNKIEGFYRFNGNG